MAKKPRFNLRNATDDPALILLIWRYSGHRIVISTGVAIPRKYWNSKNQRVKETKAFRLHHKINSFLNRLESQTLELHYDYKVAGVVQRNLKKHL